MAGLKLEAIKISGLAACVPREIDYTASYGLFSADEAKVFEKRVGVHEKRNSRGKYTTSDLCLRAAEKLVSDLHWQKENIGLLLFISQTPDYVLPSTSVILQDKLGLSKDTIALDIRLGCTGWVSGLSVAGALMNTFKIKKALLLAGETTILSDYNDTSTYPLMADAGTATALEFDPKAEPMFFYSSSDGSLFETIIAKDSGARYLTGAKEEDKNLSFTTRMNGASIFEYTTSQVLPSIHQLLKESSLSTADIDHFVFHQANKLITESLRKKLDIPLEKCPYSITQFGNTSSASIPLTILTQVKSISGKSSTFFCSSFGVGLSLANVIFRVKDLYCSELIEI